MNEAAAKDSTSLPIWHSWATSAPGTPQRVQLKVGRIELASGDIVEPLNSGVTVLVGANNSGKSTLLRQLHSALTSGNENLPRQTPALIKRVDVLRDFNRDDFVSWLGENAIFEAIQPTQESRFIRRGQAFTLSAINHIASSAETGLNMLAPQLVYFADATGRLSAQMSTSARAAVAEPPSAPLHQFQDDRSLFQRLNAVSEQVFDTALLLDDFSGGTISIRVGAVGLPIPGRQEPLGAFGDAVAQLPLLDSQGDGMRSFFGLMIPFISDSYSTILVDEPEAFLHPPQARALGKALADVASTGETQVVVATHDKDLIAGVLSSSSPVTVVRLLREGATTRSIQLHEDRLKEVWDDRTLRYTNVLDGLFAKLVVIAEAEQDCRFYEAAFDAYSEKFQPDPNVATIPSTDVLFVPSSGKAGVLTLLTVLRDLSVPSVSVLDIDVLEHVSPLRELVIHAGGDWEEVARLQRVAISGVENWKLVKKVGDRAFTSDQRRALDELFGVLDGLGIVVLRVGELEGFAPHHPKDKRWLGEALAEDAHSSDSAAQLVARAMQHYVRLTSS